MGDLHWAHINAPSVLHVHVFHCSANYQGEEEKGDKKLFEYLHTNDTPFGPYLLIQPDEGWAFRGYVTSRDLFL